MKNEMDKENLKFIVDMQDLFISNIYLVKNVNGEDEKIGCVRCTVYGAPDSLSMTIIGAKMENGYLGQGYGTLLMKYVENFARENKCKEIDVQSGPNIQKHKETGEMVDVNLAFYEKLGFKASENKKLNLGKCTFMRKVLTYEHEQNVPPVKVR